MMEDTHKLSRWKRHTKQNVQSRSHMVTSSDDIHNWIKKVEEASNKATDAAFGLIPPGKQRGKAAVEFSTGLVRNHEQAYTEAQELLTQWVNEKVRFDVEDGFDDLEAWRRARESKLNIRSADKVNDDSDDYSLERLTRLALQDDIEIDETAIYERVKRNALGETDPYANLYEMEEKDAVDAVLQNMLSKEVVKETFKKDLGFNTDQLQSDPRTKMELRHNMVKENREKRQKQEDRKKMEAQIKKEARLKAQQLIQKEQKDRETRARKEEMALKKDMIKIRKEMHDERTRKAEEMRKTREKKELMDRLAREELERQMTSEDKEIVEVQRLESDRRKKQMIQIEMVKSKIASRTLQCLHKHLIAWYDLVLSKRLLMGKVKAMSDWKLMLKVWGHGVHTSEVCDWNLKWRFMKEMSQMSRELVERRHLEKEQQRTKNKMMSLLNAVVEKRVEKEERGTEGSQENRNQTSRLVLSARSQQQFMDSPKIEQMFQQPIRKQAWADDVSVQSSRSQTSVNKTESSRSETSVNKIDSTNVCKSQLQNGSKGKTLPTQPWQVNKQHLKLTKMEILNLSDVKGQQEGYQQELQHTDSEIRKKFGTQPWMKKHFVVNNLEHRYTAQQQTLREQQNQIREQKQLIEELQYEQRQQGLKQHLILGSCASPLPPEVEYEVPGLGYQIPRGDNNEIKQNLDDNKDENNHNRYNNTILKATSDVTFIDTGRSESATSRTDHSVTTTTAQVSLSLAKTQNPRYLKVLKNIEDRSAQRAKLKAEREEKKRKQEKEKMEQLLKLEDEAKRVAEADKKAKVEAYRQKKLLEKQKELDKQRELLHLEEMNKMADEHYQRSVLKYRGLLPFKKIISLSKRNHAAAVKHRDRAVVRKCLKSWKQFAEEEASQKRSMADQMHQFLVIKHSFQRWKNHKYHMRFLMQRALRYYQDIIKHRLFLVWVRWVAVEKEETVNKMEAAQSHYKLCLTRMTFLSWRHLPERMKKEEERQKRKIELRKKVSELIPDFSRMNLLQSAAEVL